MDVSAASPRVAVITGASSGIGAATAEALSRLGYELVLGARRMDRLVKVATSVSGKALELDVCAPDSVQRFMAAVAQRFDRVDVLVNSAGLALGQRAISDSVDSEWMRVWETNVLGMMRMTRDCLPLLRRAACGHVVNVSSVAAFDLYPGGAAYTSSKQAVHALTRTLRLELNGEAIRVTEIAPGITRTEFALVRFGDDREAESAVYRGIVPLRPEDIAECVAFAVTRPLHVDIDELVVRPVAQAGPAHIARGVPGLGLATDD